MLNKSGKTGHPCLVPDLRGNTSSFSLLSMMLAGALSYFYVEICSLYAHFLESFYHKWMLNFVKSFFCISIEMMVWFIFFNLLIWCITLIDLRILKSPCIPGINHLIMVYDPFNVLLDSVC